MNKLAKAGLLMSVVIFAHNNTVAQDNLIEALDLSKDLANWYDAMAGKENPILLQGKIADLERKSLNSHAYLGKFEWIRGDVTYREQQFQAVPLLFDLEKGKLLALRNGDNTYEMFIELKSDLVSDFKILDAKFIRMGSQAPDKAGFYEVLFNGDKLKFYAKRKKQLEINGVEGLEFVQSDQYFLQFNDEYYVLRSANSLARLFKENRKLIKAYANKTNIRNLNNETDKQFILLVAYCDSLIL